MVTTQVELTEEQVSALNQLAARSGVSVDEWVRRSVDRLLVHEPSLTDEERRRRALSVVGCLNSGLTDLAENHDEYLAQAYSE